MYTIMSINIDSRKSNLLSVIQYIINNNIDVIAIQDMPKMKTRQMNRVLIPLTKRDYVTFPKIAAAAGKATENEAKTKIHNLIITKNNNNIQTTPIQCHISNPEQQATSATVALNMKTNNNGTKRFILTSLYIRPRTGDKELKMLIDNINDISSQHGKSRQIIAGDTNTPTIFWAPNKSITKYLSINPTHGLHNDQYNTKHYYNIQYKRSRKLTHFIQINQLQALNNVEMGPTYDSKDTNNNKSYIDVILAGNKAARYWQKADLTEINETSKHKALVIKMKCQTQNTTTDNNNTINMTSIPELTQCYKWNKINTRTLTNLNDEIIIKLDKWQDKPRRQQTKLLEHISARMQNTLRSVQDDTISIRIRQKAKYKLDNNNNIQTLIKMREKFQKMRAKLKSHKILHQNKNNNNYNRSKINQSYLNEVWRELRTLKQINDKTTTTNQGDGTIDVDNIINEKFPAHNRDKATELHKTMLNNTNLQPIKVTPDEIEQAIREVIESRKYMGADGIKFEMLKHALPYIKDTVKTIIEMSLYTHYIPRSLLQTRGSIIPKKTKGKYRIVHITCALTALLERVVLHKLELRLQNNGLLDNHQFGFVPKRGGMDLIARILELAFKHKMTQQTRAKTLIVSLDIEGAFDNVDQNILIDKMNQTFGNDSLKVWITDFLLNRTIKVAYNDKTSTLAKVCRGVPQGSALGPILWNFAISNIENELERLKTPNTHTLMYADDIIIIHNGRENEKDLQYRLDFINNQLSKNNLRVSAAKSSIMNIAWTSSNHLKQSRKEFMIQNETIPTTNTINLMGIPINNKLRLNTKDNDLADKIIENAKIVKLAHQTRLIKNHKLWKVVLESYIQSMIIDKHVPILAIDDKGRQWADKTYIKVIRHIFNWPSNISTKATRLILNTNTTDNVIEKYLNNKLEEEMRQSYTITEKIFNHGSEYYNDQIANEPIQPVPEISPRQRPKFYIAEATIANNRKRYTIKEAFNTTTAKYFVILETSKGTAIAEMKKDTTQHVTLIKHAMTYTTFFDSLAALRYLIMTKGTNKAHQKQNPVKLVLLSEKSSLYQAITNPLNRNWRITKLKNAILANKIKIHALTHQDYTTIKQLIISQIGNDDDDDNSTTTNRSQNMIESKTINWPNINEYVNKHQRKQRYESERSANRLRLHTGITKVISRNELAWQTISPHLINAKHMLAISGMTKNKAEELVKGKIEKDDRTECCNKADSECEFKFTTAHKILECTETLDANEVIRTTLDKIIKATTKADQQQQPRPVSQLTSTQIRQHLESALNKTKTQRMLLKLLAAAANLTQSTE